MAHKLKRDHEIKEGDILKRIIDGQYYPVQSISTKQNKNNYIFPGMAVYGSRNLQLHFDHEGNFLKVYLNEENSIYQNNTKRGQRL
jgi:hypothetical protein